MNLTLRCALSCAKIGWYTFPISKHGDHKKPATKNGVLDATIDEALIRDIYKNDRYYLAIATGLSGLAVLDEDPRTGGVAERNALTTLHGAFPLTPAVRTGRGDGGLHYYFRAPTAVTLRGGKLPTGERDPSGKRLFHKGLDFKVGNSYLVCPPSVHESGGVYEWVVKPSQVRLAPLPQWLVELGRVTEEPVTQLPRPSRPPGPSPLDRASKYLARCEPSVQGQNGSSACLKAAMFMCQGFDLSDDEALYLLVNEYNPRCQPPWSLRELTRKVKEANRLTPPRGQPRGWLADKKLERRVG